MSRKLARLLAALLLATYGLIAVVGSGGAHRLGGISHRHPPGLSSCHRCCHGHDHKACRGAEAASGEEEVEAAEAFSGGVSSHGPCPICHWFSQCKSETAPEPPRLAVAASEERLSPHRQCLFTRSFYRPSRPRAPPVSG